MNLRAALLASTAAVALAVAGAPNALTSPGRTDVFGADLSTDLTTADVVNAASGCGIERWAIKTASDSQRNLISTSPTTTTIAALRTLRAPSRLPSSRVRPTETSEYVVSGTLLRYKLESDGDLHLVVADGAGRALIVEIADPSCATASRFRSEITTVRRQFLARFNPTSSFKTTHTPVRVRGVGFFDFQHGQSGVAPNGIELHPVLALVLPLAAPSPVSVGSATAICKDGTRSYSQTRSGTCSHHGGVSVWL
jgi:hypothetical protein